VIPLTQKHGTATEDQDTDILETISGSSVSSAPPLSLVDRVDVADWHALHRGVPVLLDAGRGPSLCRIVQVGDASELGLPVERFYVESLSDTAFEGRSSGVPEPAAAAALLTPGVRGMADRLRLWPAIGIAQALSTQCFAPTGSICFERLVDPEAPDDEVLYVSVPVRMDATQAVQCETEFNRLFRKRVPFEQRRFITVAAAIGE